MKRSIDSIRPPAPRPVHKAPRTRPAPTGTGARFTTFASTRKRRMAWGLVLMVLVSPVLFGLAMIGVIGVGATVAYGIVALVARWPSRNTFVLALMSLLYMVGARLAAAQDLASGLAVLAYVLLAIGAISLAREVKSASRLWFKKH